MGLFRTHRNWAAFFCRVALAAVFIPHGLDKLVKFDPLGWSGPEEWNLIVLGLMKFPWIPEQYQQYLHYASQVSAWTEAVGGGLCVVGLLIRLAMIPMIINMAVGIALVHARNGYWSNHTLDGVLAPGFEYPMVLILIMVGLFFSGAGSMSIDKLVASEPDYHDYEFEDEYEDDYEPDYERRRRY
ncbi:MAG: DoxX family protein [Candidatus Sumerlaeaceae bacterium]|nr:DoxX family protein [Candidatus Sumerlaeaceae bacterium]